MNNVQQGQDLELAHCPVCLKVNTTIHKACRRCGHGLRARSINSLYQSWALLFTSAIFLILANIYPITIVTNQGVVSYETIFSGVYHLLHSGMFSIAIIVFIASILVPWLKIIGMAVFLIAIRIEAPISRRKLMIGFHIIEWVGRWSMLDLFVISVTVSLVNIGQLLDVKPGPGATAFALVILFTQLAAKVLDTRLLWDRLEQNNDRH